MTTWEVSLPMPVLEFLLTYYKQIFHEMEGKKTQKILLRTLTKIFAKGYLLEVILQQ